MRIFFDANILFSAADPETATHDLFAGASRLCEVRTNPHALEEARRNLQLKRAHHLQGLERIRAQIVVSAAFRPVTGIDLPTQDMAVIGGAVGSGCSHLWTGDKKHFGGYYGRIIEGVAIVSSTMLADVLLTKGWRPSIKPSF